MGIHNRGVNMANAKGAMTMKEFQEWELTDLDAYQLGKITKKTELADAVRRRGDWSAGWRASKGIRSADSNKNGVVDEIDITNLAGFPRKHLGLQISEPFEEPRSPGGMDSRDGKHRLKEMSDRYSIDFNLGKIDVLSETERRMGFYIKRGIDWKWNSQNYDFTEDITEAGLLSAPAKSEAESMFLTEEQLKEVFKRFKAIEEPVLHRKDLQKAFNHFGLFFPRHAATVFDAKKEGSVKLTELDDLVNSAVRLGYTVN